MKTHANQVAAWGKLLGHCNALGATYNPSKESMKSTALTTLLEEAQESIQAVHNAKNDLVSAINVRHRAFDKLPSLGTRIMGALEAMDTSPEHLADVNRIRLRFRYLRSKGSALKTSSKEQREQNPGVNVPPADTPRGRVSYLGFDSKIENFAMLIGLLNKEAQYAPNEVDLSIESLNELLADLREKQQAVGIASLALYKARQHCKKMLFQSEGIYGVAIKVKKYIRSIFGFNSEQYQAVRKIKFKK
jgi:hypothetical protein